MDVKCVKQREGRKDCIQTAGLDVQMEWCQTESQQVVYLPSSKSSWRELLCKLKVSSVQDLKIA